VLFLGEKQHSTKIFRNRKQNNGQTGMCSPLCGMNQACSGGVEPQRHRMHRHKLSATVRNGPRRCYLTSKRTQLRLIIPNVFSPATSPPVLSQALPARERISSICQGELPWRLPLAYRAPPEATTPRPARAFLELHLREAD
jgi:hypothetical protein